MNHDIGFDKALDETPLNTICCKQISGSLAQVLRKLMQ